MKKVLTFLLVVLSWGFMAAQDTSETPSYEKRVFQMDEDEMPYAILLPENYDASKSYPLLLFLHGAGERGSISTFHYFPVFICNYLTIKFLRGFCVGICTY